MTERKRRKFDDDAIAEFEGRDGRSRVARCRSVGSTITVATPVSNTQLVHVASHEAVLGVWSDERACQSAGNCK